MMQHSLSPTTHTIHLTADTIDAGQIIALARQLDATECKGAVGDDNQGGLGAERRPSWTIDLDLAGKHYGIKVIRLVKTGASETFAVVATPVAPREAPAFAHQRDATVYAKHWLSQLHDCPFRLQFDDRSRRVLIGCNWLDSSLLADTLRLNESWKDQPYYIDPVLEVWFEMQGHRFCVNRRGPELVLIPEGESR